MVTVSWDVSCMQLTRPFPTHPAPQRHVHFIRTCVRRGLRLPLIGGSFSLSLSGPSDSRVPSCHGHSSPGPYLDAPPATHITNRLLNHVLGGLFSFIFLLGSFRKTYVGCNAQKAPLPCTSANWPRATSGCPFEFVCGLP